MKDMRKYCLAGMSAALIVSAAVTGCGKTYESVTLPTAESGRTDSGSSQPAETEDPGSIAPSATALETPTVTETAPSFTDTEETVYVTGDQVNLRSGAGTDAQVVTKLSKGTALKRTGVGGDWSRVIYQEKEGYISSGYVSTTPPETSPPPAIRNLYFRRGSEVKRFLEIRGVRQDPFGRGRALSV